jgi:L1 cell adhesion molecule like protein
MNKLDSLVYQTRSTIENDNIKSKIEETDLKLVHDVLTETELWLDSDHTKEEYENKMTEVNSKINPIMMKVYSEGGEGGMPSNVPSDMPSDMPSAEGTEGVSMPSVDEID